MPAEKEKNRLIDSLEINDRLFLSRLAEAKIKYQDSTRHGLVFLALSEVVEKIENISKTRKEHIIDQIERVGMARHLMDTVTPELSARGIKEYEEEMGDLLQMLEDIFSPEFISWIRQQRAAFSYRN